MRKHSPCQITMNASGVQMASKEHVLAFFVQNGKNHLQDVSIIFVQNGVEGLQSI